MRMEEVEDKSLIAIDFPYSFLLQIHKCKYL